MIMKLTGSHVTAAFILAAFGSMSPGLFADTLGPINTSHGEAYLHTGLSAPEEPGARMILLEIQLEKGWHTYWKNPGDSGTALQHSWKLPDGWKPPDLKWPAPRRIPAGPLMTYGYEGTVYFPFQFQEAGASGPFRLKLEWLECADVCIPARVEFQGMLNRPEERQGQQGQERDAELQNTIPEQRKELIRKALAEIPPPFSGEVAARKAGDVLELTFSRDVKPLYIFPENGLLIEHAREQSIGKDVIGLPLLPEIDVPEQVEGVMKTETGHYSFVARVTHSSGIVESIMMSDLLTYSGLAFLGGLILNLMPCVLPVLSLKVFHLINLSGESRSRLLVYTGSYSAGVIVSFLALSGLLIALRAAGEQLGWGFHLQSSGFLVFMILFLSLFAFNLLGVFEIGLSLTSISAPDIKAEQGSRALGSAFLSGVLATVVASPCTAPFMGSAIGFALSQSAMVTLTVFFFLGLGLASPFLLAGLFPPILKIFPRPGAWMVRFKQLLAFPLLATVGWLLWVLGNQTSVDGMTLGLMAVLLLGLASYIYGNFMQPFSHKPMHYVAALLAAVFFFLAAGAGYIASGLGEKKVPLTSLSIEGSAELPEYTPGEWMDFSPEMVDRFRAANVPVFVDFTADWCLSCKVNERTVLSTDRVQELFLQGKVATFKADWTNEDPVISRKLEELGRNGVPTYALYLPGARQAELLPELLTIAIMEKALTPLDKPREQEIGN